MAIPTHQQAVELIGPDQLRLNPAKSVYPPGPYQVLARVEAVGLCFSDLKLLSQFGKHPRKGEILSGIDRSILSEIPSYCPGSRPTVPGHEISCVIEAVGEKVRRCRPGQRVLVQTDYRWLKTAGSNAAVGYNFEGALQQYVLFDERVYVDPESGESFLIPVKADVSASAVALVEPWACVESSYVTEERRTIRPGGRLLVVADEGGTVRGIRESFGAEPPAQIFILGAEQQPSAWAEGVPLRTVQGLHELEDGAYDDIVYFGCRREMIERLNDKLAAGGIVNIVLDSRRIGQPVSIGVGRIHYGMTRWIGTTGPDARESYQAIPATGEIRDGERAVIVGAGGPMGQMHVIRMICSGCKDLSVTATDLDEGRLAALERKVRALLKSHTVRYRSVLTREKPDSETYSYFALMAPIGALVADAVARSRPGTRINVFAGIPAAVRQEIDLDRYIANQCYLFGTSGSRLRDMQIVLDKLLSGRLDTNCSIDAVSGMAGAIDGILAVKNRTLSGKIVVYPLLEKMPLLTLSQVCRLYPDIAEKMPEGIWTKEAERQLLKSAC